MMRRASVRPRRLPLVLHWLACVALLALALHGRTASAAEIATTKLVGHVDALAYMPATQRLQVQGWAWDIASGQPAADLQVVVGNQRYAVDVLTRTNRVDVRAALGPSVGQAGFAASLPLPTDWPEGAYPVAVTAVWPDGTQLLLPTAQAGQVRVQAAVTPTRHWMLLALVVAWIAFAWMPRMASWGERLGAAVARHTQWTAAALVALFVLLVALGVTGSSWQLLAQGIEGGLVQFQANALHMFAPRYIRSDEWAILTTNALAQWNHLPPFPVVNANLGPEGQNMGVIGMTGVPIAQWAALARPATWGYFFLPLSQAMAWHWQLPFFACLLALWRALALLLPGRPGFNLALAVTFCVAPYAAGWSLWPLYASFFPVALFVALAALLQSNKTGRALALGTAMGFLLAGWVLVLYPPWQITVGTCMALLTLGWVLDHRAQLQWRTPQWLALALMLAVATALLASWWLDTSDAVARMRATVYPGARTALQGAEITGAPWWALRGYLNTETLTFGLGTDAQILTPSVNVNESEMSSYILLPLPLLLLGLWRSMQPQRHRWTLRACMVFVLFWLVFRFAGVPLWLAQSTLWSYVPSIRLDLALGLTCTALFALLWMDRPAAPTDSSPRRVLLHRLGYAGIALSSAGLVALEFNWTPRGLLPADSAPLRWAIALAIGYSAWWVMHGRMRPAAGLLLLLSLVATLGFNPWSLAPHSMQLAPGVAALASDQGRLQRTLVISDDAKAAVTLVAAGVPVVNSVLYYPHPQLWQRMGLTQKDWSEVNRYQHLIFTVGKRPPDEAPFKAQGNMDFVRVTIDALRFDFTSTGASRVTAQEESAGLLRGNPGLQELGSHAGFTWFAVR